MASDPRFPLLGRDVGHIRVVDGLGSGGMGAVYLGFDTVLQRQVAVKVIRREHRLREDSKARFLREARLLSKLAHPNICTVHDFIEGEDVDVLVLELVDGVNLRTAWEGGMTAAEKLDVARQLLEVLAAVHGRGIIHRDLKPENVMITTDGRVKVLDFGLARSYGEPVTTTSGVSEEEGREEEFHTRLGAVVGTVGYMSPEQARGEPATPASDMYALGVVLQELLTEERAYPDGLSREALLLQVAEGRTRSLQGLDTGLAALVERLQAVAPGARPSSVDALAQLETVIRAPRRRRRRRLRIAVWSLLSALSVGMAVQSIRASRHAARAEVEAVTARQVSDFLVNLFAVSDPSEARGNSVTAREVLDAGAARIESELAGEPEVQARLMTTMGEVYFKLGLFRESVDQLEAAVARLEGGSEERAIELAAARRLLANGYLRLSRYEEAESLYRLALSVTETELGADHPEAATVINNLAVLYRIQARYDEAEVLYRRSLAVTEAALGVDHPDVATRLTNLGILLRVTGRYDEASEAYQRALAIRRVALGDDHPNVADSLEAMADMEWERGDYGAAAEAYRRTLALRQRVLGPQHPAVASCQLSLAQTLLALEDLDGAERLQRQALDTLKAVHGADSPAVASSLMTLADIQVRRGHPTEAETLLRRAMEIFLQVRGGDHPQTANAAHNLAGILVEQGRHHEAEPLYERAVEAYRAAYGEEHRAVAMALNNLANLHRETGRLESAEALNRRALGLYEVTIGPDHPDTAWSLDHLARTCLALGKVAAAVELLERALEIRASSLGPEHGETRATRVRLDEARAASPRPATPPTE